MKAKHVFTALIFYICYPTQVEAQQWKKDLIAVLTDDQRHLRRDIPAGLASADSHSVLDVIKDHLRDSVFEVRLKALELTHHLTIGSSDTHIRQRGVDFLVSSLNDLEVTGQALSMLTDFNRRDFSDSSRAIISQHIEQKHTYLNELMRVAGYLKLTNLKSVMAKYSAAGNPPARRWAALVSLARMDDANATSEIMTRVERLPISDDVVYNVFPDLVFTRQARPVAYIIQAMHSDEKNCFSADAEREIPIPCTYRIAEQLAHIIEGFPLSVDVSGDLEATDYVKAIETLKTWFSTHPHYKILNDNY